jgi:hypothetical protein
MKLKNETPASDDIEQAYSTLYVVQATSVKFGLHVGNMIFNTQNEE